MIKQKQLATFVWPDMWDGMFSKSTGFKLQIHLGGATSGVWTGKLLMVEKNLGMWLDKCFVYYIQGWANQIKSMRLPICVKGWQLIQLTQGANKRHNHDMWSTVFFLVFAFLFTILTVDECDMA